MSLSTAVSVPGERSRFLTPPFVLAMVMLGTASILVGPVARWMDFKPAKAAIPLRAPLGAMDVTAIHPYRVVHRHVLESTIVEALGTDQYLSWSLEDTSVPPSDPLRRALLFVTYDTGGQNLVPHTPDECRLGAGYQPARPHENLEVEVPSLRSGRTKVPIRVCTFMKTAVFNREEMSVVYTFHCNGRFVASRTGVRLLFHDPKDTYAYFSKVEVSFPGATREQTVVGAVKLFDRVLPVLVNNQWPDFEAAEQAARTERSREP